MYTYVGRNIIYTYTKVWKSGVYLGLTVHVTCNGATLQVLTKIGGIVR